MTKDPNRRNKGAVSENLVVLFNGGFRIYKSLVGQNLKKLPSSEQNWSYVKRADIL